MKALGLVETKGMVGAIEAADVALKTAQVELINKVHTKGGLVCIEIEGDVAAVKAAVEAAVTATKNTRAFIHSSTHELTLSIFSSCTFLHALSVCR